MIINAAMDTIAATSGVATRIDDAGDGADMSGHVPMDVDTDGVHVLPDGSAHVKAEAVLL